MNVRITIGAAALLASATVGARNYNYQDIPIGERAFGMGSVSMALDGDVGNIFFNPATLARETSGQVSATLSTYTRIDSRSGDYVSLLRSTADNVSRGGFVPNPAMVGGNLKAGAWTWGGAILVPYIYETSGKEQANGDVMSFEGFQEDVWLGAFAARSWGDWDFGATLFYVSRESDEKFFFVDGSETPGATEVRFYNSNFSVNGLLAVFGGAYQVSEAFRVGFSIRTPVWAFGGAGSVNDSETGSAETGRLQSVDFHTFPLPMRISGGLSYRFSPTIMLAGDVHLYAPVEVDLNGSDVGEEFDHDARAVANASFGAEILPWEKVGFRTGLFTNLSAARTAPRHLTAIQDKVHMFGLSAAVFFPKKTGSISLGGYVQGGQGSIADLTNVARTVPRTNYFYGFVIGSNYRF